MPDRLVRTAAASISVAIVIVAGVAAGACSGSGGDAGRTAKGDGPSKPDTGIRGARVEIAAPAHGTAVGSEFTVRVQAKGVQLFADAGRAAAGARVGADTGSARGGAATQPTDAGFVMLQLDGGKYDLPKWSDSVRHERVLGLDQNLMVTPTPGVTDEFAAGDYSVTSGTTLDYRNIPKGRHTLRALLMSDSASYSGASHEVTFTVR